MRAVAFILVLLVARPALGEDAPQPPPPASHGVIDPGQRVQLHGELDLRVVPEGGAVYLEKPAYTYAFNAREWEHARAEACEKVSDQQRLKGLLSGTLIGVIVGALLGASLYALVR